MIFDDVTNGNHYVSTSENNEAYRRIKNSIVNDLSVDFFPELKEEYLYYSKLFDSYILSPETFKEKNNQQFIDKELLKYKDFFDTVEDKPLTKMQRISIITNEDNNLIVAGAGSGKTSVMVAKVLYLLDKGYVNPDELLVLAYNTKAKQELEERLSCKTKFLPRIMTFHGLGNHILRVGNTKKILSTIATDSYKFNGLIRKIIVEGLSNSEFADIIQEYFQEFFYPLPNIFNFKTEGEYWDYLESYEVRTLNNEKVKSIEECIIANFLYINGIKYTYEKQYIIDTQTPDKKQYHPDFYLDDYDVYIEHFAIDKNCKTPPFIDNEEYVAGIKWKRSIHEINNTNFIETYSFEKYEGKLLSNLKQKLKKYGIVFNQIDINSLFDKLNKADYIDTFTELLGSFLNHFKSNQLKMDVLKRKLRSIYEQNANNNDYAIDDLIKRQKAFIKIFEPVFDKYENNLKANNEIDFNDMILLATKYHELGLYESKFKYILVDEFQDISQGRALLLKELLKNEQVKLCCVGDDWQSIYRFSGSDISIMRNFEEIFGATKRIDLDMTFRFDNQINDVATKFITKNPNQLTKNINTIKHNETPSVLIYYADKNNDSVFNVLHEIEQNLKSPDKNTVLILSRFNKMKQKPKEEGQESFAKILKGYQDNFKTLNISFSSVHGSKGLGFDYVILIDMNRGAFPLEKIDDPILGLVLPQKENYPNAEERRLFYVALTRAKEKIYLIPDAKPSAFIAELETPEYNVGVYGTADNPEKIKCPKCGTGLLIKSSTQKSYICSHTNYCDYLIPVCNKCHKGFAILNPATNQMECFVCKDKKQKCPECDGYLVEREGKFGKFLGCSNYPKCTYTQNIKGIKDRFSKYKSFKNYK